MCLFVVERDAGTLARLGQHRLTQGQAGERRGIERGKRMERIALEAGPLGGGHHEAVIEGGVVGHYDGAAAILLLHPLANALEDLGQRLFLADGATQGIEGVDAGEVERRLFQVGALERFDMKMEDLIGHEPALLVHLEGMGSDLQQSVGSGIEPGGFNIDDDGVKATKTALEGVNCVGHGISVGVK